jgi:hypothetical protein
MQYLIITLASWILLTVAALVWGSVMTALYVNETKKRNVCSACN